MSPVRQPTLINTQTPSTAVSSPASKSTTASHPDKIRPINKTSTRPAVATSSQSPSKSSTISSINTDVPQIEINSPSPNSPGYTATTKTKASTRDQHDPQQQQRFGYDAYMKPSDESTSHIKSPNTARKATKAANTISPVKQREHTDSKRPMATPINGNPSMNKNKMSSPRHTSTSSEEQHIAPPTPMKAVTLKDQLPVAPAPLVNSKLFNKTNQPARLFIALFDYDPNAMSPNKDNDEELPFKEGQLIRVRLIGALFSIDSLLSDVDLRWSRCRRFLHWRDREWSYWFCAE